MIRLRVSADIRQVCVWVHHKDTRISYYWVRNIYWLTEHFNTFHSNIQKDDDSLCSLKHFLYQIKCKYGFLKYTPTESFVLCCSHNVIQSGSKSWVEKQAWSLYRKHNIYSDKYTRLHSKRVSIIIKKAPLCRWWSQTGVSRDSVEFYGCGLQQKAALLIISNPVSQWHRFEEQMLFAYVNKWTAVCTEAESSSRKEFNSVSL